MSNIPVDYNIYHLCLDRVLSDKFFKLITSTYYY